MFQQMFNASLAVLRRPSVSTFEEHEKDDLGSATIYVVVGALIAAVLGAIAFTIQRPYLEQQARDLQQQLGSQFGGQMPAFDTLLAPRSLVGSVIGQIGWALVGFFIFLGLVYLIGRAFGGTGTFGQLAYDMALFWAPLAVLRAAISVIAIGPLAFLTGLVSLAVGLYSLYLTYLGIQSGMNLPPNKALIIMLIPAIIALVGCCGLALLIGVLVGAARQG